MESQVSAQIWRLRQTTIILYIDTFLITEKVSPDGETFSALDFIYFRQSRQPDSFRASFMQERAVSTLPTRYPLTAYTVFGPSWA